MHHAYDQGITKGDLDSPNNKMTQSSVPRHFTATGFVVHGDATLLHWHHRVQAWLPPGGHVEVDEDPVQAVLREVKEETGLDVEVMATQSVPEISNLDQVIPPRTILVEDVYDQKVGAHQHIDMIYFCSVAGERPSAPEGWVWFSKEDLLDGKMMETLEGGCKAPPEDVVALGLEAISFLGRLAAESPLSEVIPPK